MSSRNYSNNLVGTRLSDRTCLIKRRQMTNSQEEPFFFLIFLEEMVTRTGTAQDASPKLFTIQVPREKDLTQSHNSITFSILRKPLVALVTTKVVGSIINYHFIFFISSTSDRTRPFAILKAYTP